MTPEQTLIQQISRMIENGLLERNALLEDYAVQYAELCGSVNARLLQCANYLEKGLLSEAMYIARQSPDLLETVSLIQFPLAKKWENICVDLELTMPPLLHTEIVEKLQKASDREQALRPLLQEFRKHTYQREHRPALEVLRKIRSYDPDNQSWAENLRLLEEEELPAWLERLEKALQRNDLPELKLIEAELRHPQRVAPVPEESLKKLSRALLKEHSEELFLEAQQLMEEMHLHLDVGSEKGVRKLLERVADLESREAFFNRPENWDRMKDEAEAFMSSFRERQKQQLRHMDEEQEFQRLLEGGRASDLELRQAMQRLEKSGLPVSDLLKRQMDEVIAERRRLRLIRIRNVYGIVLVVFMVILGAVGTLWYFGARNIRMQKRLEQIDALIQQKDYARGRLFLAGFKEDYPEKARDRRVLKMSSEVETELKRIAENRRLAQALKDEMRRAQQGGFNISDAQGTAWLSRAALLDWTPEEKISLANWQSAWLREKRNRIQNSNARVRQAVQKSRLFLSHRQEQEADLEMLQQIDVLLDELRLVRSQEIYVEEGLRLALEQQLDALQAASEQTRKKIQAADAEQKRRQNLQEALDKIRNRLAAFIQPENLDQYFVQLDQMVKLGGGDIAELYGGILEQRTQQNSAFLLNHFPALRLPLNAEACRIFERHLKLAGKNTVWSPDMASLLEDGRRMDSIRSTMTGMLLEQQEQYLLYRMEYRKKGADEWHFLYMPEILQQREEDPLQSYWSTRGKDGKGRYTLYWGRVYFWAQDDEKPELVHSSKVFPGDGLNTRDYEVRRVPSRREDQLCPHGRFLIQMVADSAGVKDPGVFLLRKLKQVEKAPDLELIPRFWLKKKILNLLSEKVYPHNEALRRLTVQYMNWDLRVPWMNRKHPQTVALEKTLRKAGSALPDIDGMLRMIALEKSLYQFSLGANPRCVGVLLPGEDGGLRLSAPAPAGQELRVLVFSNAGGGRSVWLCLSADGRRLDDAVLARCLAGQPVFAVKKSCREWLRHNVSVSEEEWQKIDFRPASWPENAWIYPGRQVR